MTSAPALVHSTIEAATIRKVRNRIIPFVFVLMVIAFLDRINIGFAALTMTGNWLSPANSSDFYQPRSIRTVSSCVPKSRTARAFPALLGN
jgi:hypothetical protein